MTQSVPLQLVAAGLARVLSDTIRLASVTTFGGVLSVAYVALYTAGPAWAPGNSLSQYTEATYPGYARQLIVWGNQGVDLNRRPEVVGGALNFSPNASTGPNTIIGAMLCDAATAGNLLAAGQLTTSKVLGVTTDVLTIIPRFSVPGTITPVDWGEIVGIA